MRTLTKEEMEVKVKNLALLLDKVTCSDVAQAILDDRSFLVKLKNILTILEEDDDLKGHLFKAYLEETAATVAGWPAWKQNMMGASDG